MKNQEMFVSVDEKALESVAGGGILDILNGSVNGNCINLLSFIDVNTCVGDVLSKIGNIGNEVG